MYGPVRQDPAAPHTGSSSASLEPDRAQSPHPASSTGRERVQPYTIATVARGVPVQRWRASRQPATVPQRPALHRRTCLLNSTTKSVSLFFRVLRPYPVAQPNNELPLPPLFTAPFFTEIM
ncbi:hypothetical protein SRHO_G00064760 [Serrasalmus rhombeus]